MFSGNFDDEIWNEAQWEAHINEMEHKTNQLRKFIAPNATDNTPRWVSLLKETDSELEAVDAFIEEELTFDEAYFPDDDDEWDDEDDFDDFEDDYFLGDDDELDEGFEYIDDFDEMDEGEEWKSLSEDYSTSDNGSIHTLDIYNDARSLAASMLQWAESIPRKFHTPDFYRLVDASLKIGAKIAAGYSFGFEKDMLGGNIVFNKKALVFANSALELLHKQKGAKYLTRREYYYLHERIFDLRNDIGIYVQELRERFDLGLE